MKIQECKKSDWPTETTHNRDDHINISDDADDDDDDDDDEGTHQGGAGAYISASHHPGSLGVGGSADLLPHTANTKIQKIQIQTSKQKNTSSPGTTHCGLPKMKSPQHHHTPHPPR